MDHDEIECVQSVFSDATFVIQEANNSCEIQFNEQQLQFSVRFTFPAQYPTTKPTLRLTAPYCDKHPGISTKILMQLNEEVDWRPIQAVQWCYQHSGGCILTLCLRYLTMRCVWVSLMMF
eukprot:PhF_6_TR19190/c0_g1_i2/m.28221